VEWGGEEGNWRLACPMASHAAFPAMLRLGWFEEGRRSRDEMTAAGRLTSVNRSRGSCTMESARSDGDAAGCRAKTHTEEPALQQQCTADCESGVPALRVQTKPGRLRREPGKRQPRKIRWALALSPDGKLRQCVTSDTLRRCRCVSLSSGGQ